MIGGPGGTGKSHLYAAVRAFYKALDEEHELKFTAPTGVASVNLGCSTLHFEVALMQQDRTLRDERHVNHKNLVARFQATKTLLIDEVYFLACNNVRQTSLNLQVVRPGAQQSFGGLDLIVSGDHFQLPPPGGTALFSTSVTQITTEKSGAQGLSKATRINLEGVNLFRSIDRCVLLDEVRRQVRPRFALLLNRLRRGMCSINGEDNDFEYLERFHIGNTGNIVDRAATSVATWATNPAKAAPLITYTNGVRDVVNIRCARALAAYLGSTAEVYYSFDYVGSVNAPVALTGRNAEAAWISPPKKHAGDLHGRLLLVVGMPIIVVDNLATECGVAKGANGTLVGLKYDIEGGRKYLVSVTVDLPSYTSTQEDEAHPHRLTLGVQTHKLDYEKDHRTFRAHRRQVPIVPGFAFTVHASQSRTLQAAILDLDSAKSNLAAIYVMLSRITDETSGLAIVGEFGDTIKKTISQHVSEERRAEESRLQRIARQTLDESREKLRWYCEAEDLEFDHA